MKIRTGVMTAALAATTMFSSLAFADQAKHEKKFCNAIEKFSVSLSKFDALDKSATVGELRNAADRVSNDASKVVSEAKGIKSDSAKQFTDAAKQLRTETQALEGSMTVDQARTRIDQDIENVRRSGQQLADESGCPAGAPTKKDVEGAK